MLAEDEYGDFGNSTAYGPFATEDEGMDYLREGPHSNPGAYDVDPSGRMPDPTKSPNGRPVIQPRKQWGRW